MQIPELLQQAIERETKKFSQQEMIRASEELSTRYRQQQYGFTDQAKRAAYIAVRMPATFAAVWHVLEEVRQRAPQINIKSMLDLGSGPGTAMWAATELFPSIHEISLLEKDLSLAELGKRLALENRLLKQAQWQIQDLELKKELPPHDLLLFSYSIGELSPEARIDCLEKAWSATRQLLVIIEPGTPAGFARIRALRSQLIALKGHMVAPCPHCDTCPMTGDDWCHFSARVERSSLHRRLKSGELGYEDEKFSYLVFSKEPSFLPQNRVLRHPLKRTGHIHLTLCSRDGFKETTISKKTGELYKLAKKTEWGSAF